MKTIMIKVYRKFILLLLLITFSCSESNTEAANTPTSQETSYVIVNGIKTNVGIEAVTENIPPSAFKKNGVFNINFWVGVNTLKHYFNIQITEEGKVFWISDYTDTSSFFTRTYYNYRNFSDYFIDVLDYSFNEQQKTFKLKLKANLFLNTTDLQSEYLNTEMNLNGNYEVQTDNENYLLNNRLDYFNAKLNNVNWIATNQYENGSFTNYDSYKIVVKFISSSPTANYPFTNLDTMNCMKFYKFNTVTFQYDEFNVSGNINLFYKEFHGSSFGLSTYSFFGTFSLTAINPNDPSEVISVTDGKFRTLNPY